MKHDLLKIAVMTLVLPVVLLCFVIDLPEGSSLQIETTAPTKTVSSWTTKPSTGSVPSERPSEPVLPPTQPTQPQPDPSDPKPTQPPQQSVIRVHIDGGIREMDMEEYVLGVVLAEMPASFHVEALKAQAVACRSYALIGCMGRGNHKEGFVCTSPGCCQAYTAPESYIQQGGRWENVQKVWKAVQDTQGLVLCYDRQLVLATYFSCSGGRTEAAVTVFGVDYPYLQPVESPEEDYSGVNEHAVTFTPGEFAIALRAELVGSPTQWIGEVNYTQGGGVDTILIGKVTYDGLTVKSLLGLRSSNFTIEAFEEAIVIYTQGYGHRVGMSQYGAQAMAEAGNSYTEILTHYYTGTSIEHFATII